IKEPVRSKLKTEEDLDEWIKRDPSVKASPDYKEKYAEAKKYLRGKRKGPVPKLIKELWKDEVKRVWTTIVESILNKKLSKIAQNLKESGLTINSNVQQKTRVRNFPTRTQFERFLKLNPELSQRPGFTRSASNARVFIDLMQKKERGELVGLTVIELAEQYGMKNHANISRWLNKGTIPHLIKIYLDDLKYQKRRLSNLTQKELLHRLDYSKSKEIISLLQESKNRTKEKIDRVIKLLLDQKPNSSICYVDLRISKLRPKWFKEAVDAIRNIGSTDNLRIAIADSKLYLWKVNPTASDWIDLYVKEFFRFKSKVDKFVLIDSACKIAGLNSRAQLRKLLDSFYPHNAGSLYKQIQSKRPYLKGAALKFILEIQGLTLSQIRKKIHSIGRMKGGRILNPRFPTEKTWWSRIVAAMLSDGNIAYDSKHPACGYYEVSKNRVNRVVRYLCVLGDVEYNVRFRNGIYHLRMPATIARMIIARGLCSGDKAIMNPHVPRDIMNGGSNLKRLLLSGLVVEDGCVHSSEPGVLRVSWTRTIVLDAGNKSETYGFKSRISKQLKKYFIKYGTHQTRLIAGRETPVVEISPSQLRKMSKDKDSKKAQFAEKMLAIIRENRSKLLDDEVKIARELGIKIRTDITVVTLYKESSRISVQWRAQTKRREDAIRYLLLSPPDDLRKNRDVAQKFEELSDDVSKERQKLKSEGYDLNSC
ncbi:MAG: hypothetical protein RTU63_09780, partial [Candidatus Thorarchaeota archaeon]